MNTSSAIHTLLSVASFASRSCILAALATQVACYAGPVSPSSLRTSASLTEAKSTPSTQFGAFVDVSKTPVSAAGITAVPVVTAPLLVGANKPAVTSDVDGSGGPLVILAFEHAFDTPVWSGTPGSTSEGLMILSGDGSATVDIDAVSNPGTDTNTATGAWTEVDGDSIQIVYEVSDVRSLAHSGTSASKAIRCIHRVTINLIRERAWPIYQGTSRHEFFLPDQDPSDGAAIPFDTCAGIMMDVHEVEAPTPLKVPPATSPAAESGSIGESGQTQLLPSPLTPSVTRKIIL